MTIGDLFNKMYLAFSTTTDYIIRMEKNMLVVLNRDEQDRRVVFIHLLDEDVRIIEEVIAGCQNYLSGILTEFN